MHRIWAYVELAIILIIIISILYLPILFFLKKRGKGVLRQLSYLALFCSFFLIILSTILWMGIDFTPERYILNIKPFKWVEEMKVSGVDRILPEIIPNIMMFIPLGIFIPVVFKKKRRVYKVFFITFIITCCIELFQYFIGRSCDIDDIISNVLGGIIGYIIFKICNYLFKNKIWWNKFIGENLDT